MKETMSYEEFLLVIGLVTKDPQYAEVPKERLIELSERFKLLPDEEYGRLMKQLPLPQLAKVYKCTKAFGKYTEEAIQLVLAEQQRLKEGPPPPAEPELLRSHPYSLEQFERTLLAFPKRSGDQDEGLRNSSCFNYYALLSDGQQRAIWLALPEATQAKLDAAERQVPAIAMAVNIWRYSDREQQGQLTPRDLADKVVYDKIGQKMLKYWWWYMLVYKIKKWLGIYPHGKKYSHD